MGCIRANAMPREWPLAGISLPLFLLLGTVLAGCAATPSGTVFPALSPEETEARLIHASDFDPAPDTDVLALSGDVRHWIDTQLIGEQRASTTRLKLLSNVFAPDGALKLEYDPIATYSASETFARREGNCLSFTHLFIAMARDIGLDAGYREIPGRPSWEAVGDYVVVNRHMVAYGRLAGFADYTVDFGRFATGEEASFGHDVSDASARAQHFNNLGARSLTRGDVAGGLGYLNRALLIDPSLAYVWTNLGTAYMQLDRFQDAEAALLHALRLDRFEVTAINQTERLYERLDRHELAQAYHHRAERARYQNPYARFWRGVAALERGEVRDALGHLRKAVREEPDELQFRLQLAKAYALLGRSHSAQQEMLAAVALAGSPDERRVILEVLQEIVQETSSVK